MRIGVLLPTRGLVMADARRPATDVTWAMLDHAEKAGYEHVWVGDSIVAKPRHEPLVTLAFAAGRTRRVRLGTAVLLPALRHPVVLADELATLDHVSQGRLILGVAPGWGPPAGTPDLDAAGQSARERGRRLEEHIEVWRELWSGRPVTRRGRGYELRGGTVGPLPWAEQGPPILVTAGNRGEYVDRAFARFARYGDGIISTNVEPDECREIRRRGEAALAQSGRELRGFPLAVYVTVRVDSDRTSAERRYQSYIDAYYGAQGSHERGMAGVGSAEDVAAVLMRFAAAGVTDLIVRFAGDDQVEQLERFTEDVRPSLEAQR